MLTGRDMTHIAASPGLPRAVSGPTLGAGSSGVEDANSEHSPPPFQYQAI